MLYEILKCYAGIENSTWQFPKLCRNLNTSVAIPIPVQRRGLLRNISHPYVANRNSTWRFAFPRGKSKFRRIQLQRRKSDSCIAFSISSQKFGLTGSILNS